VGGQQAVAADDGHIGEGAPGVAAGGQVLQDAVCRERGISSGDDNCRSYLQASGRCCYCSSGHQQQMS